MPRSQSSEKKKKINKSDTIYHINNEQQTQTDQNQIQASLVKQKEKKKSLNQSGMHSSVVRG